MTLPQHPLLRLRVVAYAIIAYLVLALWIGPTSAEIRLDTGDVRIFFLGIPLYYDWQQEPARSQLLGIAAQSKVLRPDWHKCPLHEASNNVDLMLASFYREAADWTAADPEVARISAESIASYIKLTGARHGLPDCVFLLGGFEHDASGKPIINTAWRREPIILDYLKSKGYVPPSQ